MPESTGRNGMGRFFSAVVLAYLVACSIGMAFVVRDFGVGVVTAVLALLPAIPLVIAERIRLRPAPVLRREFAYLAAVALLVPAGAALLVRVWYAHGMDFAHAEDVRYGRFADALKGDPAFRNVEVRPPSGKGGYWITGMVRSRVDLDRLHALAARSGIEGGLQGPIPPGQLVPSRGDVRIDPPAPVAAPPRLIPLTPGSP